jgi:hypothetical protein
MYAALLGAFSRWVVTISAMPMSSAVALCWSISLVIAACISFKAVDRLAHVLIVGYFNERL